MQIMICVNSGRNSVQPNVICTSHNNPNQLGPDNHFCCRSLKNFCGWDQIMLFPLSTTIQNSRRDNHSFCQSLKTFCGWGYIQMYLFILALYSLYTLILYEIYLLQVEDYSSNNLDDVHTSSHDRSIPSLCFIYQRYPLCGNCIAWHLLWSPILYHGANSL